MTEIAPGKYLHYKGNEYDVIGVARHSETLAELVVYQSRSNYPKSGVKHLWVRPIAMFLEDVEVAGKIVPRFKKLN